jgi:NADH-quinone oxidoreductase subunit M
MLTGLEAGSTDISLPLRAGVLLGFGFALLLAIFPFNSWIPLLAEQNHPYMAGFVLVMLQTIVLLFGVNFLDHYTWLQSTQSLPDILRLSGTLMVVTGGVLCAFQRHLGRMMGYAIMVETGTSLLAVSIGGQNGMGIFSMLFFPRILSFAIWALSLAVVKRLAGSLDFRAVACLGRRYPVVICSLILAHFSAAGLPLLAGFPVKVALWGGIAQQAPFLAPWILIGTLGLLIGGLRSLSVLVAGTGWSRARDIPWQSEVFLGMGIAAILLVGVQPQLFLPMLLTLLRTFNHLL